MTIKITSGLQQSLKDSNSLEPNHTCFPAGTLVHTDKGLVPIQDIKVGDMVLSRDQHNPEGELVYKPVVRTIVTENVPVFFGTFTPSFVDNLPFRKRMNPDNYVDFLSTNNHPFWISEKKWVEVGSLKRGDCAILKNGELAFFEGGSSNQGLEVVFKTDKSNIGFIPNFAEQSNHGRFVDLETGRTLSFGSYDPVFRKLFVEDTHWRKRLLEQTPAEYQDNAEFYGFRTGFWQDGAGIDWAEGEGPVTTTVYNIEVADTHTYFVGEHGVWVHNCGGDIATYSDNLTVEPNHVCFAAGTLVHTEQGLIPIEHIKVGDKVLSKNADGSGELVYKAVTKTMATHNSPIFIMWFGLYFDSSISALNRINMELAMSDEEARVPDPLLLTANHPLWTENRGWIKAQDLTQEDILVTKDNHKFVSDTSGGYEGRYQAIKPLYHSGKVGYGYDIKFGDDTGQLKGTYINLSTGEYDLYSEPDPKWINKLWTNFDDWKQNLLDQTPVEHRDRAEFYGFRTGGWIDPDTITWAEGEGPLTMTVYNIEVEDTHTYFVGEAGIWVHNCDTEPTYSNSLTVEHIDSLLPAAKQYWINAGITKQELNEKLANYQFEITQLQQNVAAVTDTEHGMIRFSPNASGYGWFIDNTPLDSNEFTMSSIDLGQTNNTVQSKFVRDALVENERSW